MARAADKGISSCWDAFTMAPIRITIDEPMSFGDTVQNQVGRPKNWQ
jgi:hypothetical protein